MARIAVGMVFLADYDQADDIITQIQQQFEIEVLHVQTSYQKLWITKSDHQEGNNDEN